MESRRLELEAAYRATKYRFDDFDRESTIRIGEYAPIVDALLQRHSATTWAYVTAYNPDSIASNDLENAARFQELRAEVRALEAPFLLRSSS